ncbi:MAG TPA: hypothetical protein VG013_05495 [Gemmataceae bacterium]|jgi:hypothetical protein|nr:hypothetical protein [Gemmataceae bacterium]
MDFFAPDMNGVYTASADLLLRHHRLLADGDEASDETAAVDDRMTEAWKLLDASQRESLSGFGSDMNWVRRSALAPCAPRPQDVSQEDLQDLATATEAGQWHKVLHQLRGCAPKVALFQLACLRAAAWKNIGRAVIASVFDDYASRLERSHAGSLPGCRGGFERDDGAYQG